MNCDIANKGCALTFIQNDDIGIQKDDHDL